MIFDDSNDVLNKNIREEKKENFTDFTFINTNARSICPKINSLIDAFCELDAAAAVITETWLADGELLEEDRQDLLLGDGLSMICKNRKRDSRGMAYGGVAVFFREEVCNFKQISIAGREDYEVVIAAGSMRGHQGKVVIVAAYILPNCNTATATGCIDYVNGSIVEIKQRYKDPYIIVSGDFNQWPIENAMQDFLDMREIEARPTRGSRTIDRTLTPHGSMTRYGV